MFSSLFKKKSQENRPQTPSIMGLRIGCSFELDSLMLKLIEDHLIIEGAAKTQIIEASGVVDLEETKIYRFYTDDEAFLQVVAQGGTDASNVIDVKLFHYYKTLDVSNNEWSALLNQKIGVPTYQLEGHTFSRVWESTSDYHQPVHMREYTYAEDGSTSMTDQFTMLFERHVTEDLSEFVFLSAEETDNNHGGLNHCLVISTGMSLSPSQIQIHG